MNRKARPASLLAALALSIAPVTGAQETKVAEPRAGVAKARGASSKQAARPRIATQKLMRYPWKKPEPKMAAGDSPVSTQALPH